MALSREEIIPGLVGELESFGELLRSLDESEWEAPSRCEGWRVADVAAHAVGNITFKSDTGTYYYPSAGSLRSRMPSGSSQKMSPGSSISKWCL